MKSDKPVIIFDTDMDTDCDDVGAFAILLQAHSAGIINLIGAVADSVCRYAAPCCEAIAEHYGVELPTGAVHYDSFSAEEKSTRFGEYLSLSSKLLAKDKAYNKTFADKIQKTDKDYPSAVKIYRRLLSQAEDGSVTVVCVGMLTAVVEALCSTADELSELDGIELFRRKVKKIITMGVPEKSGDFNWSMDSVAAEKFFEICPVPIYISPEGRDIITGEILSENLPKNHPLRLAYEIWTGKESCGRSSWDLIAALYAIELGDKYLTCSKSANFTYDRNEKILRTDICDGKECKIITLAQDPQLIKELLNKMLLGEFES